MSSIGYRYHIQRAVDPRLGPEIKIVYFIRSRTLGELERDDLTGILGLVAFEDIQDFIRIMSEQMQEMISRAFVEGLEKLNWKLELEWDLVSGFQISMVNPVAPTSVTFKSIVELEKALIVQFGIEPLPQVFQDRAPSPTIPGL